MQYRWSIHRHVLSGAAFRIIKAAINLSVDSSAYRSWRSRNLWVNSPIFTIDDGFLLLPNQLDVSRPEAEATPAQDPDGQAICHQRDMAWHGTVPEYAADQ